MIVNSLTSSSLPPFSSLSLFLSFSLGLLLAFSSSYPADGSIPFPTRRKFWSFIYEPPHFHSFINIIVSIHSITPIIHSPNRLPSDPIWSQAVSYCREAQVVIDTFSISATFSHESPRFSFFAHTRSIDRSMTWPLLFNWITNSTTADRLLVCLSMSPVLLATLRPPRGRRL